MRRILSSSVLLLAVLLAGSSFGELLERSGGVKIGDRMTLRPFVSMSFTYDSNVSSSNDDGDGDMMFSISPHLSLAYDAENWSLLLSGYYNYHQYFRSENGAYCHHSFGEDLRWNWSNSLGAEKGWSLTIGQSFRQINASDDLTLDNGQNYGGDSRQIQFAGAVQRRINEFWHGDANADYYWLDYLDDAQSSAAYYGWSRWRVGLEGGFAPSQWTDFLVNGAYQGYSQDNAEGSRSVGANSSGWTFQAGLGSYMTERISYRALFGWSRFDYGDGASTQNGFVYTLSGNWKIGETWNTMLLASSYYQPSERQYASVSRVDAISWGLAKVMVRGKLRATLDLRYRRETNEYVEDSFNNYDYVLNIITGRIGLSYSLNRFLSVFANAEYQRSLNSEAESRNYAYDYNRIRGTLGLSLSY